MSTRRRHSHPRLARIGRATALALATASLVACDQQPRGELVDAAPLPTGRLATAGAQSVEGLLTPTLQTLNPEGLLVWAVELGGLLGPSPRGNANAVVADAASTTFAGGRLLGGGAEDAIVTAVDRFRNVLWEVTPFGGGAESEIAALALAPDGLYAAGYGRLGAGVGSDQGLLLVKLRPSDGAVLWSRTVEVHPDLFDLRSATTLSLDVAPSGRVGMTGLATQPDGSCAWFVAVHGAGGVLLWSDARVGSENLGADAGHLNAAVEGRFDAAGNYLVGGVLFEGLEGSDVHLVKYSPAGAVLWDRSTDAALADGLPSFDQANAVAVDPVSGRAWVAGSLASQVGADDDLIHDGFVRSYDAAGNALWTSGFAGSPSSGEDVLDLAVGAAGEVYAVGTASSNGLGRDLAIQRIDAAGATDWLVELDVLGDAVDVDGFERVVLDGEGGVFAVGRVQSAPGVPTAVAVKLDAATGAVEWTLPPDIVGPARSDSRVSLSRSAGAGRAPTR